MLSDSQLSTCEGSCSRCNIHYKIKDKPTSNLTSATTNNNNMETDADSSSVSNTVSGENGEHHHHHKKQHKTIQDDPHMHHEPLPPFIRVQRPSGNVKMFCSLWTLLMTLIGITAKLYGYMKIDATSKNKSYSLSDSQLSTCEGSCSRCNIHYKIKDKPTSNLTSATTNNNNMETDADSSSVSNTVSGENGEHHHHHKKQHKTIQDDPHMHHEPLPPFIRVQRPSGNVKMFCSLWTLLMTLIGITAKLYGYMKIDATSKNKSYSLYTSFIQLFGIACLLCLLFLQWKQKRLSNNHLVYDPHNGSFYLKAGLVGFTIGTLAYNTLQLAQDMNLLLQQPECGSKEYSLFHMISFVYNVLQCILLLLFSKVTFTYRPNLALLCLSHLVAVCLHSWFSFVADEFTESLDWEHERVYDEHREMCAKYLENSTIHENIEKTEVFLFPMSIELYLIAGGFFAIMSTNVGKPHVVKDSHKTVVYGGGHKSETNSQFFFQETFSGFFVGIALVLFTGVLVGFKHLFSNEYPVLPLVFHWFIFTVNIIMLGCIALIHTYLRKRGINKRFHNRIDAPLLFIALGGIAFYSLFSVFAGIHGIEHPSHDNDDAIGTLVGYGSHLVQSVVQTVFLLDSLRRVAAPTDMSRNFILVLLGGNVALWVTQMFEMNFEGDVNPMQVSLFGDQHWTLISHIFGPLAIFFRFHSAACLYDIWHTCYRRDTSRTSNTSSNRWRDHFPVKFSTASQPGEVNTCQTKKDSKSMVANEHADRKNSNELAMAAPQDATSHV